MSALILLKRLVYLGVRRICLSWRVGAVADSHFHFSYVCARMTSIRIRAVDSAVRVYVWDLLATGLHICDAYEYMLIEVSLLLHMLLQLVQPASKAVMVSAPSRTV
jgi:hypothetical protein